MKIPLIVGLIGLVIILGMGMVITNFTVYLGEDPTACNNCHVMDAAYEGWFHAGHSRVATCTECHVPHDFVPKYLMKAYSGMNHVLHFTLGDIPEPIRAQNYTKDIIQANCIRCHAETVSDVADGAMDAGRYCVTCHRSVAHGQRGSSILPYQDKGAAGPYQLP
jgi:cytochrome c nitrite reductase small subunit